MPFRRVLRHLFPGVLGACVAGIAVGLLASGLEDRYRAIRVVDVQPPPETVTLAAATAAELPFPRWIHHHLRLVLNREERFPREREWTLARKAALRRTPQEASPTVRLERFHPVDNPPNDDDLRVVADAASSSTAQRLAERAATRLVANRARRIRRILTGMRNELRIRARLAPHGAAGRLASRAEIVDGAADERTSNLARSGVPTSVRHLSPSVGRDIVLAAIVGAFVGLCAGAGVHRTRARGNAE